jgi:hypothetical protein
VCTCMYQLHAMRGVRSCVRGRSIERSVVNSLQVDRAVVYVQRRK